MYLPDKNRLVQISSVICRSALSEYYSDAAPACWQTRSETMLIFLRELLPGQVQITLSCWLSVLFYKVCMVLTIVDLRFVFL